MFYTTDKVSTHGHTPKPYNKLQNNFDSTCVLISQQVCFHSAMKHENGISNVV